MNQLHALHHKGTSGAFKLYQDLKVTTVIALHNQQTCWNICDKQLSLHTSNLMLYFQLTNIININSREKI
jgi:hypothetical protein